MRNLVVLVLALVLSLPVAAQEAPELEPITAENMDRLTGLYQLELGEREVQELLFSPDETHFALLLKQQSHVDIREAFTGLIVARLGVRQATLLDVDFSPDGRLLAAMGDDGNIYIWNTKTSEQLSVLRGHDGLGVRVIFSPDGSVIASSDSDKTRLWELATGELLTEIMLPGSIVDIAFSPDGNLLAVLDVNVHVELWDTSTLTQFLSFEANDDSSNPLPSAIAFSSDGRYVIVAEQEESGYTWDITQSSPQATRLPNLRYTTILDRTDYITLLPYLNDEDKVWIVNIVSGEESEVQEFIRLVELPETFSPDDSIYLTASSAIVLWDIASSDVTYISGFDEATFSPGGKYIATWTNEVFPLDRSGEVLVNVSSVPQVANPVIE